VFPSPQSKPSPVRNPPNRATKFPEEPKELIAFYQSPAGKAFMAKQPELMRKSMQLSQKTMMSLMPKIMAMGAEVAAEAAKEKADKPVESSK